MLNALYNLFSKYHSLWLDAQSKRSEILAKKNGDVRKADYYMGLAEAYWRAAVIVSFEIEKLDSKQNYAGGRGKMNAKKKTK